MRKTALKPAKEAETGLVVEENGDLVDDAELDDLRDIVEMLRSNDMAGGMVRLDRKGTNDEKFQFAAHIPVTEFSLDHVKRIYGGGDYKARAHRADGRIHKRFDFSV